MTGCLTVPLRSGAGKGTYSTRVAQHLGLTPIAAGDLVRDVIVSGSDRGRKVRLRRHASREPRWPLQAERRRRPTYNPYSGA